MKRGCTEEGMRASIWDTDLKTVFPHDDVVQVQTGAFEDRRQSLIKT
jgi:hypothetical protein